jgi:glycosyltransferase involved in cell wall biosynthesis
MRIAFFVYEYPPAVAGGLGTYATNITRAFVRQGHDVVIFTMNHGNVLKTREIIGGVEAHRPLGIDACNIFPLLVNEELRQWGSFFNDIFTYNILSASKFVNQLLEQEGHHFDVVAVHDWLSAVAGLIVHNETDLPIVFHVHSTEWGRRGNAGSAFVARLEREMAFQSDHIITVSHAMKDDLNRHGWSPRQISVVWNGVDPSIYDPDRVTEEEATTLRARYGIGPEDSMILFVGRLTWVKGVRNLIQSMPMVREVNPSVKLVILGKGQEQRDVEELVHRLNLANHVVTRYAFASEWERLVHYAASDLCVLPSVYEPFGIVALEAMSMARPVVVGAHGVVGLSEQVIASGTEQTGIHVNGSDPADIAWGINMLLANIERAREIGTRGRTRVLNYFTWEQVAEQTLEVYKEVIAKGSRGDESKQ